MSKIRRGICTIDNGFTHCTHNLTLDSVPPNHSSFVVQKCRRSRMACGPFCAVCVCVVCVTVRFWRRAVLAKA